jgi:hypothetical protein
VKFAPETFSQLDDELLAIDAQAGYCYSLNETAGRVWDLIATPMSLDAICAQLLMALGGRYAQSWRQQTRAQGNGNPPKEEHQWTKN